MYAFALFWRRSTKAGVITGLVVGTIISVFWILFEGAKTSAAFGVAKTLTGQAVLYNVPPWPTVDPIVIALPIAFVLTVVVSLLTKPQPKEQLDKIFKGV